MASIARMFIVLALVCVCTSINAASQCADVETCYIGGVSSIPCAVSTGECPPCVTLIDGSCYVQVQGACAFGVDCSTVFSSGTSSSSSRSEAASAVGSNASSPSATASSASSLDAGSSSVDADSSTGGSNTVLVVAILAVALGVVMLAVVLRKLFIRARAASEEDQEEIPSPPGTIMTASFSSNGTSRDPGIMISRSAMGTELSVASKTSSAI